LEEISIISTRGLEGNIGRLGSLTTRVSLEGYYLLFGSTWGNYLIGLLYFIPKLIIFIIKKNFLGEIFNLYSQGWGNLGFN